MYKGKYRRGGKPLPKNNKYDIGGSIVSGLTEGYTLGKSVGPEGAIIGAIIGGVAGAVSGSDKEKKEKARMLQEGKELELANTRGTYNPYVSPYAFPFGGTVGAEVEKEEVVQTPDGVALFNGPSHEDGGIDISVQEGSRVFSDRLKPAGSKSTYARIAAKESRKLRAAEKMAAKNPDTISRNTVDIMFDNLQATLDGLFNEQESQKELESSAGKYPDGGEIGASFSGSNINTNIFNNGSLYFPRYRKHGDGINTNISDNPSLDKDRVPYVSFSDAEAPIAGGAYGEKYPKINRNAVEDPSKILDRESLEEYAARGTKSILEKEPLKPVDESARRPYVLPEVKKRGWPTWNGGRKNGANKGADAVEQDKSGAGKDGSGDYKVPRERFSVDDAIQALPTLYNSYVGLFGEADYVNPGKYFLDNPARPETRVTDVSKVVPYYRAAMRNANPYTQHIVANAAAGAVSSAADADRAFNIEQWNKYLEGVRQADAANKGMALTLATTYNPQAKAALDAHTVAATEGASKLSFMQEKELNQVIADKGKIDALMNMFPNVTITDDGIAYVYEGSKKRKLTKEEFYEMYKSSGIK